jgi:DNA-binding beta-propeller fold protein YncE
VICDPGSHQQQTSLDPGLSKKDTDMTKISRIGLQRRRPRLTMKMTKLALIATAVTATISVAACSKSTPQAGPTAPTSGPPESCQVNPETGPMPTAEPFRAAPESARVSVALSGITSGIVKPGSEPTEVDVTLCNNSTVSYPKVGVVLVLERCSCATTPIGLPSGTVERFDPATDNWIKLKHPVMGTGMDYLGTYTNTQDLPKGKAVTLRYRVALDASMTDGKGGVKAAVVVPDGMIQIGKADLPFTVSTAPTTPTTGSMPTPRQATLPFTGFDGPYRLAVDTAGNVYVTDTNNNRVLKLAAGSTTQTVLPFTGLNSPGGIAVDTGGNVYVADPHNNRVLKLAAGSTTQTLLPFTGLDHPSHVAVDSAGNVYVTDMNKRVLRLAAGSSTNTVLPITGLNRNDDLAVDPAGNVYIADSPNNQVVKLAAGASAQTVLPITGIKRPANVAVDSASNVYVIDSSNRQVVKLAAGSNTQTALPISGLNGPLDVAVDTAGDVYVLDNSGFGQVVKLAAS